MLRTSSLKWFYALTITFTRFYNDRVLGQVNEIKLNGIEFARSVFEAEAKRHRVRID